MDVQVNRLVEVMFYAIGTIKAKQSSEWRKYSLGTCGNLHWSVYTWRVLGPSRGAVEVSSTDPTVQDDPTVDIHGLREEACPYLCNTISPHRWHRHLQQLSAAQGHGSLLSSSKIRWWETAAAAAERMAAGVHGWPTKWRMPSGPR